MGKARRRVCLLCDRLIIEGDSWSWHCKSRHTGIKKFEVTFEYILEVGL